MCLRPALRPRQDRRRQALQRCRRGPRYVHDEGSHDKPYFGAPSHGLGTRCLRFVVWVSPAYTQDSLPAVGHTLRDGIGYPQHSYERFLTVVFLLSQAIVAQGHTGLFFKITPSRFRQFSLIPTGESRDVTG